LKKAVNKPIY